MENREDYWIFFFLQFAKQNCETIKNSFIHRAPLFQDSKKVNSQLFK